MFKLTEDLFEKIKNALKPMELQPSVGRVATDCSWTCSGTCQGGCKQLARLIRRICPNKMYIDWENYNKIGFPVDYYGVTLKNGTILKNRIYYLLKALRSHR